MPLALLLTLLTAAPAHTADAIASPAEMPSAADQAKITAESLRYETEGYAAAHRWQNLLDLWQMARTRSKYKQQEFLRAEQLNKSQFITAEAFVIARFLYDCSLNDIRRLEAEAQHALVQVELARASLLYWGNPGAYSLEAIAAAQLTEKRALRVAQQAGIASLETERELTLLKLKMGNRLKESNTASQADLDLREFNAKNVEQRLGSLKSQILITEKAIESASKALAALRKNKR